jgi:hypothetical protein
MKPNPHPVSSSVRKFFFDFFERGNTTNGLGASPNGGLWDILRGAFKIDGFAAVSDTDPSQYPLAKINIADPDVDISLFGVSNGTGAALWVTDAGDWFAVGIDQHPVECNCDYGTECNRWNSSNVTGYYTFESGGRNAYNFASGQYCQTVESGGRNANYQRYCYYVTSCSRYAYDPGYGQVCVSWSRTLQCINAIYSYNAPNYSTTCNTNFSTAYNAPNYTTNINGWNAKTCNRWNEYAFNCETCYPQWIRILQSAAGTVTTLASFLASSVFRTESSPLGTLSGVVQDGPITNYVRSLVLRIRGQQVEVDAYSDPGALTKIDLQDGDIVYTPTGAEVTPQYGIIVTPSEYDQTNSIGGIQIRRADYFD